MSITCELTVRNESNGDKHYYLFQDNPQPENGPTGKVFANVYNCSPKLQSGNDSHVKWSCSSTFYAIYGTTSGQGSNTKVETGASKKIKLGPNGSVIGLDVDTSGDPAWSKDSAGTTNAKGGFTLTTNSFTFPNKVHAYIGVGGEDPRGGGGIIPLQTYEAEPLLKSVLYPHLTYFVATGKYEAGTLVDRAAMGQALKVQFTGAAIPAVTLTQNNSGRYVEKDTGKEITGEEFTTPNGVTLSISDVAI